MIIRDVLLVCVGNICRSPMAEAVMQNALSGRAKISVTSAGIGALEEHPAAEHSVALMADRGFDISGHRGRQLTKEIIAEADLILVMESGHKREVLLQDPTARGKVYRLCEWQDEDIPDPYQQPIESFKKALASIDRGVQDWAAKIDNTTEA